MIRSLCLLVPALAAATAAFAAVTPAALQRDYEAEARRDAPAWTASAERGAAFFRSAHGRDWSCATCHGETPLAAGRHARTGTSLAPLAPAAQPRALHRSGQGREVVQAQLQRRARPRLHAAGKGRRAGLAALAEEERRDERPSVACSSTSPCGSAPLVGTFGLLAIEAQADAPRTPLDATYRAECGTCHVAYPPRTPRRAVVAAADGLARRATSAPTPPSSRAAARAIARLPRTPRRRRDDRAGAGRRRASLRPPGSAREHREVPATAWTRPRRVKHGVELRAPATRAPTAGDFDEHAVRIPRS